MNRNQEGKIVPLSSATKNRGDANAGDERISLPVSPPGLVQADRMLGYFPSSLKEYYRRALMEYKEANGIGNQKLRDLIMEPEDAELRVRMKSDGFRGREAHERDTRLTLDDLKKWFGSKSSHLSTAE